MPIAAAHDAAVHALRELRVELEHAIIELRAAGERLDHLALQRAGGLSWFDIVSSEERPLVVETVARVLDDLGESGSIFRREQALALRSEGVSITRISQLFGVSRQRISAVVRDRTPPSPVGRA